MILTKAELTSLVQVQLRNPHRLLGMNLLGDGSGIVVRAYLPNAASVEIVPTHEKTMPRIKLKRLHESGLYEGATKKAARIYAYDLVITDYQGNVRQTRDPYSFLPTLGETDLYLFGTRQRAPHLRQARRTTAGD